MSDSEVEQVLSSTLQLVVGWAQVTENGSKDFLEFLHNDSSGNLMKTNRARF